MKKRFLTPNFLPILILVIQNLIIFSGHYFRDIGFPYDFTLSYYPFAAFWTSAVNLGIFPQWNPFQGMGYPAVMNLSYGMYYPPMWLFPLLHVPFTLSIAVTLQCLHVLLGSIGMFCLLRLLVASPWTAVAGAAAFQFFGGFYSNAQHVDIIRACALVPWLWYACTLSAVGKLPRRSLLIPLFVCLLATGGYPGNLIASLFTMAVFILLQLTDRFSRGERLSVSAFAGLKLAGLALLGLAMACVHLAPVWVERLKLTRYLDFSSKEKTGLAFAHLPGFFLPNNNFPGEPSMTSTYITLPVLILIVFLPLRELRRSWYIACIGLLATLMVSGSISPVFRTLTALIPPLGFSRFPSSDYRVILAVTMIIFAMFSWESLLKIENWPKYLGLRVGAVGLLIVGGLILAYRDAWYYAAIRQEFLFHGICVLLVILALAGTIWFLRRHSARAAIPATLILLALIIVDGFVVVPAIIPWKELKFREGANIFGWPQPGRDNLTNYYAFKNPPISRPHRENPPSLLHFSEAGYVTGAYVTIDPCGTKLSARQQIETNPLYFNYMLREWRPLFFAPKQLRFQGDRVEIPDQEFQNSLESDTFNEGIVTQTSYGMNEINYTVSLAQSMLLVENEIYFPGWKGEAFLPAGPRSLHAYEVNGSMRGWLLPAGSYRLATSFHFPHFPVYLAISGGAVFLWLFLVFLIFFGARSTTPPSLLEHSEHN